MMVRIRLKTLVWIVGRVRFPSSSVLLWLTMVRFGVLLTFPRFSVGLSFVTIHITFLRLKRKGEVRFLRSTRVGCLGTSMSPHITLVRNLLGWLVSGFVGLVTNVTSLRGRFVLGSRSMVRLTVSRS